MARGKKVADDVGTVQMIGGSQIVRVPAKMRYGEGIKYVQFIKNGDVVTMFPAMDSARVLETLPTFSDGFFNKRTQPLV